MKSSWEDGAHQDSEETRTVRSHLAIVSRKAELLIVQVAILHIEKEAIMKVHLAITFDACFGVKSNTQMCNVPQCQKCKFVWEVLHVCFNSCGMFCAN